MLSELINWKVIIFFVISCLSLTQSLGTQSNQICLVTMRPTQLTEASFKKNQMLQNVFLISVTLRWHSGFENHEIWTFKVNFLCQKDPHLF